MCYTNYEVDKSNKNKVILRKSEVNKNDKRLIRRKQRIKKSTLQY